MTSDQAQALVEECKTLAAEHPHIEGLPSRIQSMLFASPELWTAKLNQFVTVFCEGAASDEEIDKLVGVLRRSGYRPDPARLYALREEEGEK